MMRFPSVCGFPIMAAFAWRAGVEPPRNALAAGRQNGSAFTLPQLQSPKRFSPSGHEGQVWHTNVMGHGFTRMNTGILECPFRTVPITAWTTRTSGGREAWCASIAITLVVSDAEGRIIIDCSMYSVQKLMIDKRGVIQHAYRHADTKNLEKNYPLVKELPQMKKCC
jgi:hypothetical protein